MLMLNCWLEGDSAAAGSLDKDGERLRSKAMLDRLLLTGGIQSQCRCWITGQKKREAANVILVCLPGGGSSAAVG